MSNERVQCILILLSLFRVLLRSPHLIQQVETTISACIKSLCRMVSNLAHLSGDRIGWV